MSDKICSICNKENPNSHQDFCADLGCSGRMVAKLVGGDVRYKISYGDNSLSFSAPMAKTNVELVSVLLEIAAGLKAPSKKVIAECDNCFKFILEGDGINIIEEETLCDDCWNK